MAAKKDRKHNCMWDLLHIDEWVLVILDVIFQGVQSVVTHSLQSILHSLGGIQVSHCLMSSEVEFSAAFWGSNLTQGFSLVVFL